MSVLDEIQDHHQVDVVITPEGFLDSYVSTVKSVNRTDMVKYAIDPPALCYRTEPDILLSLISLS